MVTVWLQLVHFAEADGWARQGNGVPSGCVITEEEPQSLLAILPDHCRQRSLTNLGNIFLMEVNKDQSARFKETLMPGSMVQPSLLIPVLGKQRQVNSVNSASARATNRDPVSKTNK